MSPQDWLLRQIGWMLAVCLVLTAAALIYGHTGATLNLADSFVSDYIISAPRWPWLVVACFIFAVVLMLLAIGFLLRENRSPLIVLAGALLGAASMGAFFVAYAPVRHAKQPPPAPHAIWTPSWWFASQTAHTPYEKGMADAYSDVHYHASRLALGTGVAAILLLAVGHFFEPSSRRFAIVTLGCAAAMSLLFLLANHPTGTHGIWQRCGMAVLYVWLWLARRQVIRPSLAQSQP